MTKIRKFGFRKRVQLETSGVSKTVQYFKDECDINKILAKYAKTGIFEHVNRKTPQYGDFTKATSFSDVVEQINAAYDDFANLPAIVRKKFNNSAVEMVEYLNSGGSLDSIFQELKDAKKPKVEKAVEEEKNEPGTCAT